jgi:hypothetical protein
MGSSTRRPTSKNASSDQSRLEKPLNNGQKLVSRTAQMILNCAEGANSDPASAAI